MRDSKENDLLMSRDIDIESIRTICLALGPYRNLTTMTASILFLHPNCQVLNHAAQRIFGDDRIDFIENFNSETFDHFVRYAIYISQHGQQGQYGGSITHSHAFDGQHEVKGIFEKSELPLLRYYPGVGVSRYWSAP